MRVMYRPARRAPIGAGVSPALERRLRNILPEGWGSERYLPPVKGRWIAIAYPVGRSFDHISGHGDTEAEAVRKLIARLRRQAKEAAVRSEPGPGTARDEPRATRGPGT